MIIPENVSKLTILFIKLVDMTTSSKTGTEPPETLVLPPCVQVASLFSLQYVRILDTSSVVCGFSTILLLPKTIIQSYEHKFKES